MSVVLTVLTPPGPARRLLFYNDHATRILNCRPEYLGPPSVQERHQQPASVAKIEAILVAYRAGQWQKHAWLFQRQGKTLAVRVAPWVEDGWLKGLIHTAAPLLETPAAG